MLTLTSLSFFLDRYLQVDQYPEEKHGIWRPALQPVSRLGLALEPWPDIAQWIHQYNPDALFMHRPWQLDFTLLPAHTGLISYHLPFDEKLTLGYNLLLAPQLHMSNIEPLGEKEGRPLGMTGIIPPASFENLISKLENLFGKPEQIHQGTAGSVIKITVMGAMTDRLVREAAARGVQVYITGQFRKPAAEAVAETGMHIVAVGHRQSEQFGLQLLATLLQEKWPDLQTYIAAH